MTIQSKKEYLIYRLADGMRGHTKMDPDLFKKRQYRYNWLGPTRVGITLTYDLLYRRINKKGVSFKNYEKR